MEMPAAKFRIRFFELLDEIARTRREIVITKRGRPVVRVLPVPDRSCSPYGCMKSTVRILGDIDSPTLPVIDEWGSDDDSA